MTARKPERTSDAPASDATTKAAQEAAQGDTVAGTEAGKPVDETKPMPGEVVSDTVEMVAKDESGEAGPQPVDSTKDAAVLALVGSDPQRTWPVLAAENLPADGDAAPEVFVVLKARGEVFPPSGNFTLHQGKKERPLTLIRWQRGQDGTEMWLRDDSNRE